MFQTLLTLHSIVRWLVFIVLLYALFISIRGYFGKRQFSKTVNHTRHWTATISHIQLMLGIILYTQSPVVKALGTGASEPIFFGIIHIALMLTAVIVITVGSAKAKRKVLDADKFKTMLVWFGIGLIIIFLAIPWPFSPLAQRPLLRHF